MRCETKRVSGAGGSADMRNVLIAIVFTALLAGCTYRLTNYDGYRGDGIFTRIAAPSVAYKDGYRVDLGSVDLTSATVVDHRLDGLPTGETTIGLALVPMTGSANDISTFRPSRACHCHASRREEPHRALATRATVRMDSFRAGRRFARHISISTRRIHRRRRLARCRASPALSDW